MYHFIVEFINFLTGVNIGEKLTKTLIDITIQKYLEKICQILPLEFYFWSVLSILANNSLS